MCCGGLPSCVRADARRSWIVMSVFFFQAEDGIRDLTVTGVQTCALPISTRSWSETRAVICLREVAGIRTRERHAGNSQRGLAGIRYGNLQVGAAALECIGKHQIARYEVYRRLRRNALAAERDALRASRSIVADREGCGARARCGGSEVHAYGADLIGSESHTAGVRLTEV